MLNKFKLLFIPDSDEDKLSKLPLIVSVILVYITPTLKFIELTLNSEFKSFKPIYFLVVSIHVKFITF